MSWCVSSLISLYNSADQENEREVSQAKLNEALLEKDQVSNELNAMEKSFSGLFKRLEKHKEIIQGYKKVRKHLPSWISHKHMMCF